MYERWLSKRCSNVYSINFFDVGNEIIFECNESEVGIIDCKDKCTFSKYRIIF